MNSRLLIFVVLVAAVGVVVVLTSRSKPEPAEEPASAAAPSVAIPATPARASSQPPASPIGTESFPSAPAPAVPAPSAEPAAATALAQPAPMPVAAVPPGQDGALAPAALPLPQGAEINPEEITRDLDELSLSLRDYRTQMAQNPIGNNAEITKALMGGNPRNAQLAPPGARMNGKGEMVDRWGTAYFFHQMSATSMEIHSAGPDRQLGTDDDIVHR